MARQTTKGPRVKLNSIRTDRPLDADKKLMYYVLLSGLKPSGKVKEWSVEARISATMSATGQTEAKAIANLLEKIRSAGGEASIQRLKLWRLVRKPIPEHLRSCVAADG